MTGTALRDRRPLVRALFVAGLLAVAVLGPAAPAQAHAVLVGTTPAPGYRVPGPVDTVTLAFSEPVSAGRDAVRIAGPTPGLRSRAEPVDGGRTLVVATGLLHDGAYRVQWQVTADDGDVVDGGYSFAVGTGVLPAVASRAGAASGSTGSLLVTSVLRWVLFAGLAVALGGLAGEVLTGRLQRAAADVGARGLPPAVRLPVAVGAAVGALAATALTVHSLDGASWPGGLRRLTSWQAVAGPGARLPALEVLLLAVGALAATAADRRRRAAVVPLLAVAVAEGFRGHLHEQDGAAGALLVAVHLAVAAAWTGALVVVLRTAQRWRAAGRPQAAWQLMGGYSTVALVGYLLVVGTGTLAAVLILPTPASLLRTGYGQALVGKLVLVAVVTGLALLSRRRLRAGASGPLGRGHRLQPRVMVVLLAVTAVLVSLSPPRLTALAQQSLPPPAPVGPVEQLGARAGQLTVGLSVSAGQLRVQVASPASDDGGREQFAVNARSGPLGQPPRPAELRPCGPGCFAGPLDVAAPGVQVQLEVTSPGWQGGPVAVDLPWPPSPGGALLGQALALLRAAGEVTIIEHVSSDSSRPAPIAATLHDTGEALLSTEPYGDPSALPSFLLAPENGLRRVAFGVAGTYFVELTVDAGGRPVAERLVTPNHLISREIHYSP